MKTCSKCKQTLSRSEFHKCAREKSGLKSRCKACRSKDASAAHRKKNPEVKQKMVSHVVYDYGEYVGVDVSTPKHRGATMLIDYEDWRRLGSEIGVNRCSAWQGGSTVYATANVGGKTSYVHRLIISGEVIDHINGNGLDNRKSNLRACTQSENTMNRLKCNARSGKVGVSWSNRHKRWCVEIRENGKRHYLGWFDDLDEAVKTRRDAELKFFGEFAPKQNQRKTNE